MMTGIFVLMDPIMSDIHTYDDDDRLHAIICFCILLITDEIVWLCKFP